MLINRAAPVQYVALAYDTINGKSMPLKLHLRTPRPPQTLAEPGALSKNSVSYVLDVYIYRSDLQFTVGYAGFQRWENGFLLRVLNHRNAVYITVYCRAELFCRRVGINFER